jgi:hypothetical protein
LRRTRSTARDRLLYSIALILALFILAFCSQARVFAQPTIQAEPGCSADVPDGPEKTTGGTQKRDAVRTKVVVDCTGKGFWAYVTNQYVRNAGKPWEMRSGIFKKWIKLDDTLGGCPGCSGSGYMDPWVFGGSFNGTDTWSGDVEVKIYSSAQFAFGGPLTTGPPPSTLTPLQTLSSGTPENTF